MRQCPAAPGPDVPADPKDSSATPEGVSPSVRATILATEHWSLLGSRSTTWAEVMSRITIHLTVTSAALVVLALVAQSTGFGPGFRMLSIGLASGVLLLGTLTGIRVLNASEDDAAFIAGMNRIRAAYLALDPGLADHLVTSANDDHAGIMRTYTMGVRRSMLSHVAGSTSMFMNVTNSIVAGILGALVAKAAAGGTAVVAVVGTVAGLAYMAAVMNVARRHFVRSSIPVNFPTR
jgi:hypothetical protein